MPIRSTTVPAIKNRSYVFVKGPHPAETHTHHRVHDVSAQCSQLSFMHPRLQQANKKRDFTPILSLVFQLISTTFSIHKSSNTNYSKAKNFVKGTPPYSPADKLSTGCEPLAIVNIFYKIKNQQQKICYWFTLMC